MTGRSRHDELRALAEAVREDWWPNSSYSLNTPQRAFNDAASPDVVSALLDELAAAEAHAERAEAALQEAEQGFTDAYDYGCAWPIGTSDEPQEQRGQARDTFIRNMEWYRTKISSVLEDREAQQGREPGSPDGAAVASAPTPPTFPAVLAEAGRVPEPAPSDESAVCRCGHGKGAHLHGVPGHVGECLNRAECGCPRWSPLPESAAPSEPEIHHAVSDPAPTDGRLTDAGSGSLGAEGAPPPEGTA